MLNQPLLIVPLTERIQSRYCFREIGRLVKLRNLGRCRGEGKLYLLLSISDCLSGTFEMRSSCESGNVLPVYWVEVGATANERRVVVVLFDARTAQKLVVMGDAGDSAYISIRPISFSIASKFNGQLRPSLCNEIRNIDTRGLMSSVSLSCDSVVPTPRSYILRGSVAFPLGMDIPKVRVFDSSGARVDISSVVMNPEINVAVSSGERTGASYSVEVNSFDCDLCVSLWSADDKPLGSPLVLRPHRRKMMLEQLTRTFATAFDQNGYDGWLLSHRITPRGASQQEQQKFKYAPSFSIIVPLYKTPLSFFRDMADSVLAQTYKNWELILVNSTPQIEELSNLVQHYADGDERIRVVTLTENLGITENTNRGIEKAKGDFLCFFDHDDVLEPDILFEYAKALNENPKIDLLYCDEDKLFPDGHFGNPTFKPDFSIDMVRDNNYICHLLTVRRDVYERIEPSGKELDGAQDHAMVLKIVEQGGDVHHVSKILYHWRISETSTAGNSDSKPYATQAGILAVQQHLDRIGIPAKVECSHGRAFRYLVSYETGEQPLVSLIVLTRGDIDLPLFLSMLEGSVYRHVELVLVTSDSEIDALRERVEQADAHIPVAAVGGGAEFAIAHWMNCGANASHGEILLFCHDDIMVREDNWIEVLAGHVLRAEVGVVGTMTLSMDDTVQQAGLALVDGSVVNLSAGIHVDSPGYIYMPLTTRNVTAVSGVCLATRRDVFLSVGGFNQEYLCSFADVDYCLKVRAAGKLAVYTPEAAVYHGARTNGGPYGRGFRSAMYYADKSRLLQAWAEELAAGDPYFNSNFSSEPTNAAQYRFESSSVATPSSM